MLAGASPATARPLNRSIISARVHWYFTEPPDAFCFRSVPTQYYWFVEHPEWIAQRLLRCAELVGRENVMAGAD
jgi:hypothetical protein